MGSQRFGEFQRSLGIAKHTLTVRLNHLVDNGLLKREPASDGSHHCHYCLTEKGYDLAPVLLSLAQWGDRWAEHEAGRSFCFADDATGEEIDRIRPRRSDGQLIPLSDINLKPLPRKGTTR